MKDKPETMEITERVRITETDPYGIAHHSCYAVWAEMGLRALCAGRGAEPAITAFDCKYLRSAKAGDEILIRVRPDRADADSLYRFEILRGQTLLSQGTMTVGKPE